MIKYDVCMQYDKIQNELKQAVHMLQIQLKLNTKHDHFYYMVIWAIANYDVQSAPELLSELIKTSQRMYF